MVVTWFTRLRDWTTDQANGIGIRSDYHDQEDDNFATGINASLNIAGLNSPTSDIPWGTNKITGLKAGTLASDACRVDQAQTRTIAYAADSVGTDSYAITLSPALAAYAVGQQFVFSAGTVNTGAATLNINGLGAKTIKKNYNVDLSDGDIAQNQMITVIYDGTNFQMQTPPHGLISQSMSEIYAADGGGSDDYAITLSPAISSYATGQLINFKANTKNTGAASLNVSGLGAKTIKKDGGADLADGDIAANQIVQVIYDGTNFQLLNQVFGAIGQNGGSIYAADVGGTDSYVITLAPAPTAYVAGMLVRFKANTANTGACTLNVNGLGAITIKRDVTVDLLDNMIKATQLVEVIYDGTNFQLISQPSNVPTVNTPTAYSVICAGTTSSGALQTANIGTSGYVLTDNGAGVLPTFQQVAAGSKLLQVNTSSNSTISEFNALFSSSYDAYLVVFDQVIPATDATTLQCQFGTGETPTYTASGYKWIQHVAFGAGSYEAANSTSASTINLTNATRTADNATTGVNGQLIITGANASSNAVWTVGHVGYTDSAGSTLTDVRTTGFQPAATWTAVKFFFAAGNITSGKIFLYGLRNT